LGKSPQGPKQEQFDPILGFETLEISIEELFEQVRFSNWVPFSEFGFG
jgi:hypothetical protein